jgi:hypothetical protein
MMGGFVVIAILLEDFKKEEFASESIDAFQLSFMVLVETRAG